MYEQVGLDIEANGLPDDVTKLHCVVVRDILTDKLLASCADQPGYQPFSVALDILSQAKFIYGHNIIGYDRPVLHKLAGYLIPWEKVRDTRVIAGMRWTNCKELDFDRMRNGKLPADLIGRHSLEAWGYRLGVKKGEYKKEESGPEKWATWTPEMHAYCEQDTLVLNTLVRHIQQSGNTPALAIETEQELYAYLLAQEANGWPFDLAKAAALQAKLSDRREVLTAELQGIFQPWTKPLPDFIPKRDNKKMGYKAGVPVKRSEVLVFNPASRQHISNRLKTLYGWQPQAFTPSGQPEVNEEVLRELPHNWPGVAQLIEYLLVEKRLGQLAEGDNAWLKSIDKTKPKGGAITGLPHIHGACLQSGTVTHRATHKNPNLAQVPAVGSPYGEDCRALFMVPEGWVQVGADASGLELRKLSHYMARFDGGAYAKTVVEGNNADGTDVHSVNRDALGLEGKAGRNSAKTFIYAFLYGAGDSNLGTQLGCTPEEVEAFKAKESSWKKAKAQLKERQQPHDDYAVACKLKGETLRARFLKGLPALNSLVKEVKAKAKQEGYLRLPDGRLVPVRHQHAALNSLLQGGGAVVCKRWIVRFNRRLVAEFGPQGWDGKWAALGWIHDEVQLAVRPEIAERVKAILVEEIQAVSKELNLRVPLDGEAKTGRNWAETH